MSEGYRGRAARIRVPAGFAVAAAYLIFARPTGQSLSAGAAVALCGMLVRAAAAGRIEKNRRLATGGPYAYTRNPLYLGSAVAAVGFCVAAANVWLWVMMAAFFGAVYWPVIRAEEGKMRELFPEDYPAYAAAVPLLLPRLRPWKGAGEERGGFDFQRYMSNHEYRALGAYLLAVLALAAKMWWLD